MQNLKFKITSKNSKVMDGIKNPPQAACHTFSFFPPKADSPLANNFHFSFQNFSFERNFGFTMVEIVIMLGIIVMVSTVVLVNFPAVTETIFIQRSGQEISGLLRRAQSMSLAVRSARNPQDGSVRPPCGVGVHFTNDSGTAELFGDMPDLLGGAVCDGINNDKLYNPSIDATIATYALGRNLKTQLSAAVSESPGPVSELNIVFLSPDASVNIYGDTEAIDYGRALITVVTPQLSLDRAVEVFITGQISVR